MASKLYCGVVLSGIVLSIVLILIVSSSSPQERFEKQLDKAISEDFEYSEFNYEGFSVLYPVWPARADNGVELSVTRGYCSVSVNAEKMAARQWYLMFIDSIEKQDGTIIESNEDENHIKFSLPFQNLTMVSENRIYDCGVNAVAVTITCIKEASEKTQDMHRKIFNSAKCQGEPAGDVEVSYKEYKNDDFIIEYPDWSELKDGSEHQLAVSKGICSIIVDKHNALPKDIYNWINTVVNEKSDQNLVGSSATGDVYYITYELPYEKNTITATTKIFYCNYQSYLTQVLCVNEFATEEYEEIKDYVIESSRCSKVYEIPTPKKVEEAKEQVKEEEPEVIEEIEDDIVKTNAGAEFGIDEEMVVYFINNNAFFTNIMKDFPKANIVIEDDSRELKLRVKIGSDGKITLLEDGEYSDADVTLKVPLRDALNIFGNAQNINPLTLLGFAVNVRTEPPEIKDQVIQKVLRGEYS